MSTDIENSPEVKALSWLINNFPFTENPSDDSDKMVNAIHVYAEAAKRKIIELDKKLSEAKDMITRLSK